MLSKKKSGSPIDSSKIKKGALHRYLGIPEGQEIPLSLLQKLMKNKDPHVRKMANFAINARKFNHK